MKTSELTGVLLDYWVAKGEGHRVRLVDDDLVVFYEGGDDTGRKERRGPVFSPSSEWHDGGPIIERERIAMRPVEGEWITDHMSNAGTFIGVGTTPLIAAMRAYVASKFGDTVPDNVGQRGVT
jgi:hypothetical protein